MLHWQLLHHTAAPYMQHLPSKASTQISPENAPESLLAAAEVEMPCADPMPVAAPWLVADTATACSFPSAAAEPSPAPLVAAAQCMCRLPYTTVGQSTRASRLLPLLQNTGTHIHTCSAACGVLGPACSGRGSAGLLAGCHARCSPMSCNCGGGCIAEQQVSQSSSDRCNMR